MENVKPVDGLHSMMQFEVYNFADGRRTALEVHEAVAAEALAAGRWYYGASGPGRGEGRAGARGDRRRLQPPPRGPGVTLEKESATMPRTILAAVVVLPWEAPLRPWRRAPGPRRSGRPTRRRWRSRAAS